jgi:hypothetical protein
MVPAIAVLTLISIGWPALAAADGPPPVAAAVPPPFVQAGVRFVPADEADLVVVDTSRHRLAYYRRGRVVDTIDVALGQAIGPKERRGDLRTPRGVYFVTDKRRGEFPGDFGAYYGGHWIKINYPGPLDAARGEAAGLVDASTRAAIERAWRARKLTPQKTLLGGGIGFHGWI